MWATEEHHSNGQVDWTAKNWKYKGEFWLSGPGHQGRDTTYRWACDHRTDLTTYIISLVSSICEKCCNQAGKSFVVWEKTVEIKIQEGLADWQYHTPANLPSSMCWQWWKQPQDGWRCALCLTPQPEHHLGPWKASPVEAWNPRKRSVRQGLISKIAS